jgi:hypothetical protein
VFDLLIFLVENRDHVVTKDDLIASVWGGRIASDWTPTSRINAARKAVGDSGEDQKLIRTIARSRISASRLQQLCRILDVPVTFFFEGAPRAPGLPELSEAGAEVPASVSDFLATSEGVALVRTFTRIRNVKVRRAIVALVQQVVSEPDVAV